ncbi:MAG: WXG100 family type VII secretion target [Bacilli bacterium]|nr:WXG100 family type VII secretion target [Bacilli bacterium]
MIKANYAEMQSAATEISKAAEEYKTNVEGVYQIVDSLVNHWKGADNVKFANTVNDYKNDLTSLGDVVNSYGEFLNKSAQIISSTQDEISSAAGRL